MPSTNRPVTSRLRLPSRLSPKLALLFLPLLLVGVVLSAEGGSEETRIRFTAENFWECVARGKNYEWMFAHKDNPRFDGPRVQVFGTTYSEYTGGSRGILFYSSFMNCAGTFAGRGSRASFGSFDNLAALSRTAPNLRPRSSFAVINPAIITWSMQNLLPAPASRVDGHSFQELYDVILRRGARRTAAAYLWLRRRDAEKEQVAYMRYALRGEPYTMTDWLEKRYGGELREHRTVGGSSSLQPALAIGFWLRRGLDGSEVATWSALRTVLEKYDGEWLSREGE